MELDTQGNYFIDTERSLKSKKKVERSKLEDSKKIIDQDIEMQFEAL
jgi:hypothetical protein